NAAKATCSGKTRNRAPGECPRQAQRRSEPRRPSLSVNASVSSQRSQWQKLTPAISRQCSVPSRGPSSRGTFARDRSRCDSGRFTIAPCLASCPEMIECLHPGRERCPHACEHVVELLFRTFVRLLGAVM